MKIAALVFDKITVLDIVGPTELLSWVPGAEISWVAARPGALRAEPTGLALAVTKTIDDVRELAPYLSELGIGAAYLSPFFRARAGSTHGYDVVDHTQVNPELGGGEAYAEFVAALAAHAGPRAPPRRGAAPRQAGSTARPT